MKKAINRVFDRISYVLTLIAAALFIGITAVLLINIILRSLFSSGVYGQFEIVQYGIMVCMAIGVLRTTFTNRHIHVDLLTKRFNWRVRSAIGFIGRLICTLVCLLGVYPFLNAAQKAAANYRTSDIFHFPLQYAYIVLFALLLLTAIAFFYQMCVCFAGIFIDFEAKEKLETSASENKPVS